MIFFFSATGNSLYAAKSLESQPISIAQAIHDVDKTYSAEIIGIVSPVYGHEMPALVKDFIRQAQFCTDYFYLILTYGNRHADAAELAQEFMRGCGIEPAYINTLLMVDNFLPAFDMDEQRLIDKRVEDQLETIRADIAARKHWISPVSEEDLAAHRQYLAGIAHMPADTFKRLYRVTDACIGCGICSKVCPKNCFSVQDQHAQWDATECITCMACIHACPQKAIQLNMPEKNPKARYRNEHVTLCEIVKANQQKALVL